MPGVVEARRISRISDLLLSEVQQLRFIGFNVMMDRIKIWMQTLDIGKVHFQWENLQPLWTFPIFVTCYILRYLCRPN